VISDHFSTDFKGDPLDLFRVLAQISPAPYQFYFSVDDRVYLGASPEMLLKALGETIETHPIAGTRPRGISREDELKQEQELLSSVKEKAEHLMLVDLARNDIGRVSSPGTVKVGSFMKLRKFGGVMHLVSTVTGKLISNTTALSALASCFPAGTLSGAPKIRAMELISEIEKSPRGFYGGAFLAASFTGDIDSCISIRSISIENGRARIQAGAGIVADSDPEMEYQEVQHKSKLTRKALAITRTLTQEKA
jgi:anthranilate synthase component 1